MYFIQDGTVVTAGIEAAQVGLFLLYHIVEQLSKMLDHLFCEQAAQ